MSIAATIKLDDFKPLNDLIDRFVDLDTSELLDVLGAEGVSQTKDRIERLRETPDGEPWAVWSDKYAKKREGHHDLLWNEGELHRTIEHQLLNDEVEIGSNLIYAATQNFGDDERGIPARTFLGFSQDNEQEFEAVVDDWLKDIAGN